MRKLGEKTNQITVANELVNAGKLDEIGGASYLSHLISIVPTSLHCAYYAEIVIKSSYSRRLISAAGQIESIGYKNQKPDESFARAFNIIKGLAPQTKDHSILMPEDVAGDAWAYYEDQRDMSYIITGIPNFDKVMGGYLKGEYALICARTRIGKTTMALQQACAMAVKDTTLFFSLDMDKQQLTNKNVSRITGIAESVISLKRYQEFKKDTADEKERKEAMRQAMRDAVVQLSKLKLYIIEGKQTTETIRWHIDKMLATHGCGAAFIDYLHLIRDRQSKDEHLRVNLISKDLHDIAKDYNIPLIVIHQMSRDIEKRDNKEPKLTDAREGGEEDADLVLMPMRDPENEFILRCYIAKDRLRGLHKMIELNWHKPDKDHKDWDPGAYRYS